MKDLLKNVDSLHVELITRYAHDEVLTLTLAEVDELYEEFDRLGVPKPHKIEDLEKLAILESEAGRICEELETVDYLSPLEGMAIERHLREWVDIVEMGLYNDRSAVDRLHTALESIHAEDIIEEYEWLWRQ
jgi:hypothetical protein